MHYVIKDKDGNIVHVPAEIADIRQENAAAASDIKKAMAYDLMRIFNAERTYTKDDIMRIIDTYIMAVQA